MGDELYLYYSGYDVKWGRYSVMTTVVAEAVKWAIANKFAIVNLSTGTDVSKTRWRPTTVHFQGGIEVGPSLRNRGSFFIARSFRRVIAARTQPAPVLPIDRRLPELVEADRQISLPLTVPSAGISAHVAVRKPA